MWNYRVIHSVDKGQDSFAIHEVFYDDDQKPNGCTSEAISPYGEYWATLKENYDLMEEAFRKPVLEMKMFNDMEEK